MSLSEIYLDYAAATPLNSRVLKAMQPYFSDKFFNPSSPYQPAVKIRHDFDQAKEEIARAIGGRGNELVVTAGATESVNLAFGSVAGHVITTAIEHQAVLEAAAMHDDFTILEVAKSGRVTPESVAAAITPTTEIVSIGLANNELGVIQPLRDIAEVIEKERRNRLDRGNKTSLWLHTDASQGLGVYDVNVARLGVDMLTINAAKVYGPKQVGALWAASSVDLRPVVVGGGQERGLRSGTENVAGVIGFAEAIKIAQSSRQSESARLRELRDQLEQDLQRRWPQAVVSGDKKHRLANFLHISFPGIDAERIIFMLEADQVYLATGSACAANQGTRSHVLEAIGLDPEVADGSLRITLGKPTTKDQIVRASQLINQAIAAECQRTGVSL